MKYLLVILFFISLINVAQTEKEFSVDSIDEEKLKKIISERDGKYLLVNIWATWCIPCREEFPDLVKLNNNFRTKLDIIAISVDYKDEVSKKVVPFLSQMNVNFPTYISDFNKDEELIIFFSKNWNGALPGTFIYNKEGRQILELEGKQSYESFSSILNKLQ